MIIQLDPHIIVLPGWVYGDPEGPAKLYKQFISDPALEVLQAVSRNTVYSLEEKHRYGGSHFFILGIEDMAKLAYPQLFE